MSPRGRGVPHAFWIVVALTALQPGLLVLVGAQHGLNDRGAAFVVVLLVALARRSRVAWGLLLVIDAIPLLAIGAAWGPGVIWSHLFVMVASSAALEAALLSPALRRYLARRESVAPALPGV
jgi:hypothetical protein